MKQLEEGAGTKLEADAHRAHEAVATPLRKRRLSGETIGGGMGASRDGPGLNGHRVHMGNTMNLPAEAVEASLPVPIEA